MVLSNAERQERYRQRLRDTARRGVTPEMIVRIARRLHEMDAENDPSFPPWDEYCRKAKANWLNNLPDDPDQDWSGLGVDAEAARLVAAVVRAVKYPPMGGR
jgi:hypothetical protein